MFIIPRGDCLNACVCITVHTCVIASYTLASAKARLLSGAVASVRVCDCVKGQERWWWCLWWWWWWWQEKHQRSKSLKLPGGNRQQKPLWFQLAAVATAASVFWCWNGACITEGLMTLSPSPVLLQGGRNKWKHPLLGFLCIIQTSTELHLCNRLVFLNESCWILNIMNI